MNIRLTAKRRSPDELRFDALVELVREVKLKRYPYDARILKFLVEGFGFEITESAIKIAMGSHWIDPTEWQLIATLYRLPGASVEMVEWANQRRVSLGYKSIESIKGILTKEMPYKREKPKGFGSYSVPAAAEETSETKGRDLQARHAMYPTADHVFTQSAAQDWMRSKGIGQEHGNDYFTMAGKDKVYGWQLYQLKSEYR